MDPLGVIFNIFFEIRTKWWRSSESKNNADITMFPRRRPILPQNREGILTISLPKVGGDLAARDAPRGSAPWGIPRCSVNPSFCQGILTIFPLLFREYFALRLADVVILTQYALSATVQLKGENTLNSLRILPRLSL